MSTTCLLSVSVAVQKCSGRHNVMCTKADGQWLVQQPGKCRWPAASIITTHFPHVATDIRLLASPKCVVIVLRAYNSPKINPSHPPHSDEGEEEGWESMHAHAQQNGFMDVVGYCARAGALTGRCHKTPAVEPLSSGTSLTGAISPAATLATVTQSLQPPERLQLSPQPPPSLFIAASVSVSRHPRAADSTS